MYECIVCVILLSDLPPTPRPSPRVNNDQEDHTYIHTVTRNFIPADNDVSNDLSATLDSQQQGLIHTHDYIYILIHTCITIYTGIHTYIHTYIHIYNVTVCLFIQV